LVTRDRKNRERAAEVERSCGEFSSMLASRDVPGAYTFVRMPLARLKLFVVVLLSIHQRPTASDGKTFYCRGKRDAGTTGAVSEVSDISDPPDS
jgi:hypothetical protein